MSIEAIVWALNKAPCESPTEKLVLIALANHARPDGTSAFPAVATIRRYTMLSERAIRMNLRELERRGLIRQCDPRIVAAYITRADKRPCGYDLMLSGGHVAPLVDERGASDDSNGGHLTTERGAPVAPEPYMNRTSEPSIFMSEALRLTILLADLVESNGFDRPSTNDKAVSCLEKAMRLDGRTADDLEGAIRWAVASEFWSVNIRSTEKLRHHFDRLRGEAMRQGSRSQGIRDFLEQA
jgi:hypothetical protein